MWPCPNCSTGYTNAKPALECHVCTDAAGAQALGACCKSCAEECEFCGESLCKKHHAKAIACLACGLTTCELEARPGTFCRSCFELLYVPPTPTDDATTRDVTPCVMAGGRTPTAPCAGVLNALEPPIKVLRYGDASDLRKTDPTYQNYQAEHFIPNSCFIKAQGRTGATIGGTGTYSEDDAMCYMIYDDQSRGTEHKWMTDRERMFCKWLHAKGKRATVQQWLDYMEFETVIMLAGTLKHNKNGPGLKTKDKTLGEDEVQELCQNAALCIRIAVENQFAKLGVKPNAQLKNGMLGKKAAAPAWPNTVSQTLAIPDDI